MAGRSNTSSHPLWLLQEHKNCGEMNEIEAKVKYVKLARSLRTYGVSFFLVKVSWRGVCVCGCLPGTSLLSFSKQLNLVRTLTPTGAASVQP